MISNGLKYDMKTYKNSTMDFYFSDRASEADIPCIVVLGRDRCEVKYDAQESNGEVLFWHWSGEAIGAGHSKVTAHRDCRA